MRLILASPAGRFDIEARIERPDATIGELARALGLPADGLHVDATWAPGDLRLDEAGIHEGATVAPASQGPWYPPLAGFTPVEVVVLSGPGSGRVIPLMPGGYYVGRGDECTVVLADGSVSRVHCELHVAPDGMVVLIDRSSTAGTLVDGDPAVGPVTLPADAVVTLGAVDVAVRVPRRDDRPAGVDPFHDTTTTGSLNVNRPPRLFDVADPGRIELPAEPRTPDKPAFSATSMVAPAAMGLVMVVATQNYSFALMALMSPVMAVGNWWETKRRSGRTQRREAEEYRRRLAETDARLVRARADAITDRRSQLPDLGEVLRRALLPATALWERRPHHDDFLRLSAGYGDLPYRAPVDGRTGEIPPEVAARIAWNGSLPRVPLTVDLHDGGVVGIVGTRDEALGVARALVVQAAVHHGPADLRIAVVTVDPSAAAWDWAKWLPHTREVRPGSAERRFLAAGEGAASVLLDELVREHVPADRAADGDLLRLAPRPTAPTGPTTLFVVDGHELLAGRNSVARQVLRGAAGPAAGIVVAASADRLPSVCTTVLHVRDFNESTLVETRDGHGELPLTTSPLSLELAREGAVALGRFDDPELAVKGAALPELVHLAPLLGLDAVDADEVGRLWSASSGAQDLRAPIGVTETGTFVLDFDRHGPHGLIGGTTGSGKSELLKTLVAAFAARYPPTELTFGLFDFKGGATFNDFADLPHTVGMASDLDVHLCRRALHCLRAELLHREHVFDRAGVKDLVELNERRARGDAAACAVENVPRLLVIIDEFAALAKELSGEIGSLVDLTARGRSLGVHLLLATQKPSTAVNAEIRANTRLRISLLVEDKQDSIDVVGIPDAADVSVKGRAFFRVGAGEVVPIQTALSTAVSADGAAAPVGVMPFSFGPRAEPTARRPTGDGPSDLTRLVDSMREAFVAGGAPPPRRPWPDPLPDRLTLATLAPDDPTRSAEGPGTIPFALADDPAGQTRYPVGWTPADGNLIVYGVVGSGATTTLAAIALAALSGPNGPSTHLYVADFGAGELGPLGHLPHTGAVVGSGERERQLRLVRWLRSEVERRQTLGPAERPAQPRLLVLIDNFEAFRVALEDSGNFNAFDQFQRVYADGPECGVHIAVTANRVGGVPSAMASSTPARLALRLADAMDYGTFGLRRDQVPSFVPGRGILTATGQVVQVALPGDGSLADAVAALRAGLAGAGPVVAPVAITSLPTDIDVASVSATSRLLDDRWLLALGLSDAGIAPAELVLYENEHALVAGPARSGRSTALATLASSFRAAAPHGVVLAVALRRSPLRDHPLVAKVASTDDELPALLDDALISFGPTLVLIDDAEALEDGDGRIAQLLSGLPPNVHVVAAGRVEVLRSMYGHWTQTIRRSKAGVLLQPNLDLDGDLLGAILPRRLTVAMTTGRGFLVCDGSVDLVQLAR